MTVDEIKIIVQAEVDTAISKLNQLNTATKNNTKTGLDFAKSIAGYTTGFGLAVQATQKIIGGIVDLTKESISLAAGFETAKISWGVLLGDMGEGEKMFSRIQALAAKTPLSFESVESGARTLKQFGLNTEEIIPTIKMLGDVSMGNAEKLKGLSIVYGQIMSTGRLMGQDLLQLINQGFNPLQVISKKTGESMADLKKRMEQGKISAQEVADAFKSATSEGGLFYGMMDKTATSSAGQWSTAVDNIKMQMAGFGDTLLKVINPALKAFNEQMDKMAQNKNLGRAFEEGAALGVDALRDAIKTLEGQMKELGYTGEASLSGIGEAYAEQLGTLKQSLAYAIAMESKQKAVADAAKKAADAEAARQAAIKKRADFLDSIYSSYSAGLYDDNTQGAIEYAAALKTTADAMTWYADTAEGAIEHTARMSKETEQLLAQMRLDEFARGKNLLGSDTNFKVPIPEKEDLSAFDEYIAKLEETTAEYDLQVETAKALQAAWGEAFTSLGEDLANGEASWASFGNAAIEAFVSVLKGIGGELAGMVITKLLKGDFAGSAIAAAGSAAAYTAAGALGAMKMAEGGYGTVTKPTLFLAGEAGPEDFAFAPKRKGGMGGGGVTVIQNISGSVWKTEELKSLAVSGMAEAMRDY